MKLLLKTLKLLIIKFWLKYCLHSLILEIVSHATMLHTTWDMWDPPPCLTCCMQHGCRKYFFPNFEVSSKLVI